MRWKLSETVQSMPRKQMDTYQGYTIWLHGKVTQKKRTPGNLPRRLCTSESWSTLSTRTTRRSRQRYHHFWTPLCPWPSQQSSPPPSGNEDNQQDALQSAPRRNRRAKRGDKKEATKKNPSQCSFKSQKLAGSRRSISLMRGALPESLHGS